MNKLIPILILIASLSHAEELYLEVTENLARVNITNESQAFEMLPELIADLEATNYTAQIHLHTHSEILEENKECKITPLQSIGDDYVIVETELTEHESRTKLPEFMAMPYDGTVQDADKKARKMKKTKWLEGKPTKVIKEKRQKK